MSSTKEDGISPLWSDQVCAPPFICFSACTMIENVTIQCYSMTLQYVATIWRYNTTLQYDPTKLTYHPCDWRRAIFLQADPASAQSRLDFIPHPFSLSASSFTKQLPSDEQRERQDRLFRPTGKTPLVLLPSMPISLYQLCTMTNGRRQALNFLVGRERVTILRKQSIWRYKYHPQFPSCKAD